MLFNSGLLCLFRWLLVELWCDAVAAAAAVIRRFVSSVRYLRTPWDEPHPFGHTPLATPDHQATTLAAVEHRHKKPQKKPDLALIVG